jgi:maltooligosyltrehalose trehalohydrolase
LRWDERFEGDHADVLDWYRRLIALRRSTPDLVDPLLDHVDVSFDEQACWLVLKRGAITVATNVGPERRNVPLAGDADSARFDVLMSSPPDVAVRDGSVALQPDSVVILRRR